MFELLRKCERGNIAVMFSLSAAGLLSAASVAIDMVQWTSTQAELYAAMDAAVLAGTREFMQNGSESGAIAAANDYFSNNLIDKDNFSTLNVNFKINKNGNGVAAFGEARVSTTFLGVFGVSDFGVASPSDDELVSAEGSPPGGAENLEVSLMLDVTGSMCDDGEGPCSSGTKLSALKQAASNLVDQLLPSPSEEFTIKVAVVPFSTRVRLAPDGSGGGIMSAVTNLAASWTGYYNVCTSASGSGGSETEGNWTCSNYVSQNVSNWKIMPCVTDRYAWSSGGFDLTDARPGSDRWLNAHGGNRAPFFEDMKDNALTSNTGATASDPTDNWNFNQNGTCADTANGNQVVPLTDKLGKLKGAISGLSAYGATAGVLGTAFAWYTLSPEWADIWGSGSEPRPYAELQEEGDSGAKKLRKIAVLMTDGGYNTYASYKSNDYAKLATNAKAMCDNMKDKGIELYTVGFALDTLGAVEEGYARGTLESCASDASHFVDAGSAADLVKAFDEIGATLVAGEVRLVK
jgi:hypothetical protein